MAVSVLVVAVATCWLLDLGWRDALLLGAVLAPTDAEEGSRNRVSRWFGYVVTLVRYSFTARFA